MWGLIEINSFNKSDTFLFCFTQIDYMKVSTSQRLNAKIELSLLWTVSQVALIIKRLSFRPQACLCKTAIPSSIHNPWLKKVFNWSVKAKQRSHWTDLNDPIINQLYIKDNLRSVKCKVNFTFLLLWVFSTSDATLYVGKY